MSEAIDDNQQISASSRKIENPVGFVLFDDPKTAEMGWASESGNPAFRINGVNELDQKTVWVTSVNYADFNSLNLGGLPHLKEAHFFRVTPDIIFKELDISPRKPDSVSIVSAIYQRVSILGYEQFGVRPGDYGYRYAYMLGEHVIPQSMRKRPKDNPEIVEDAIEGATQFYQADTGKRPTGNKAVTLTMPRIAYFRWLMDCPVPGDNNWKKVSFNSGSIEIGTSKGDVVSGSATRMKKLSEMAENNAMIFNITINRMDSDYSRFASFGAGKRQNAFSKRPFTPRRWVAFPELLEMSRYAHITVHSGFRTEIGKLDEGIKDANIETNFSFSKGIFLDNLVNAILLPLDTRTLNGVMPYLRAYDRMACMRVAEELYREGYYIMNYSVGKICVSVPEKGIPDLVGKSVSWGLIPNLSAVASVPPEKIFIESVSDEEMSRIFSGGLAEYIKQDFLSSITKSLASYGMLSSEIIMKLDSAIEYPHDKQNEIIEDVFRQADAASRENSDDEGRRHGSDEEIIDI